MTFHMGLASNTPTLFSSPSRINSFVKSTFPAAQDRVTHISNHLSRSNTMTAAPSLDRVNSVVLDGAIQDIDNQLTPLPKTLPDQHPGFRNFVPPNVPIYENPWNPSVFLAGSIEMGKAIQWQEHLTKKLQHLDITVCNPRRGNWSTDLVPGEKDKLFREQVEWELAALENVSVICFFFDKNTLSPVTMLELGLWAQSGKVVVCCHKDFWKSGNIHHVCSKYNVPYVKDYADLVPLLEKKLEDVQELKQLEKRVGKDSSIYLETKTELAAINVRTANGLKKAREEKQEAKLPKTATHTIHQYLKYVRPARLAFNADTKHLTEPEREKLWAQLCSSS